MKRSMIIALLLCLLLPGLGCKSTMYIASEDNDSGYVLERGADAWRIYISEDLDTLQEATEDGLKDLELLEIVPKKDSVTALTRAKFANGVPVSVELVKINEKLTLMDIEVGPFNPPEQVRRVFQSIEKHF